VGVVNEPQQTWCPSGVPDAPESVVLGVRDNADGRVSYLAEPVPAAEVLGDIPDGIEPTRVLRFASHCTTNCLNRRGTECGLVDRVVTAAPAPVSLTVPRCHLRSKCQWWQQQGVAACQQCPAVSTAFSAEDTLTTLVADPSTTIEQVEAWIGAARTA
jgi:hypothetical protein